jgi:putative FmdB family regulatory protein
MPIYEYVCDQCHSEFELLIRGGEEAKCPECGNERLDKQFSVPASHGSGADLPLAGTCGRPECGLGGCQGRQVE